MRFLCDVHIPIRLSKRLAEAGSRGGAGRLPVGTAEVVRGLPEGTAEVVRGVCPWGQPRWCGETAAAAEVVRGEYLHLLRCNTLPPFCYLLARSA